MDLDHIAMGRCSRLIQMAGEIYNEDPRLSRRYIALARKIAMRHRLPLGSKRFCKECNAVFIPGATLKVRVSPARKSVIYECLHCHSKKAFPFSKEKSKGTAKR